MRRPSLMLLPVLLALSGFQFGCGNTGGSSSQNPPPPPPGVTVTVTPNPANVRLGTPQLFTPRVSGSSNTAVTWQVNGVAGGAAASGTIDANGNYTPPASMPNPNTVTIKAISSADSTATGTSVATLLNPIPALTSVAPANFPTGVFALTVNGSNFVSGAKVNFAGSALATAFVSATKLTATGNAASAGTFAVSVTNPNPGSASSGSLNVQVTGSLPPPSACSGFTPGVQGSLNGFVPFPANNPWNQNIASATVDPNSAAIITFIGASVRVHPDFGSGQYNGQNIGIPYVVVAAGQNLVGVNFTAFGTESDPGPMPIPPNAPVEGDPNPGNGDRHALIVDSANCWLYELYQAVPVGNGTWNAGSSAVWDLQNYNARPLTWTSADAAGLPIFPGLARYDEIAGGAINHALRFTLQSSRAAFVLPATHWAANSSNALAAPMGMRLRLKSSFDISTYSATNQVLLKAMQQYGLIMADNGSSMYISGDNDASWDNNDLRNLGNLTASDFEVVLMNPIYTQANLPQGSAPVINSFTASSLSVPAGTPVTLNWDAPAASYLIVTPEVGAVRGTSVVVTPAQNTTYTLIATNEFGRSTAAVNITTR